MTDWSQTAAGAGITGALVALIYGVTKLVRRSKCASHTGCCTFDISRAKSQRATEIHKKEDIRLAVLDALKDLKKENEKAGEEGGHQLPPSSI